MRTCVFNCRLIVQRVLLSVAWFWNRPITAGIATSTANQTLPARSPPYSRFIPSNTCSGRVFGSWYRKPASIWFETFWLYFMPSCYISGCADKDGTGSRGWEGEASQENWVPGFDEQEMTEASVTILSPVANHKVEKCSPTDTHANATHAWSPQQFVTSLFKKAPPSRSQWTPGLLFCLQDNSILSSPLFFPLLPQPGSSSPSSLASLHHHPLRVSAVTPLIPHSHRLLLSPSHFRSLSHAALPRFARHETKAGGPLPSFVLIFFFALPLSSFILSCLFSFWFAVFMLLLRQRDASTRTLRGRDKMADTGARRVSLPSLSLTLDLGFLFEGWTWSRWVRAGTGYRRCCSFLRTASKSTFIEKT